MFPEAMTAWPEVVKNLSDADRKELQRVTPLEPGWPISPYPTPVLLGWKHSRAASPCWDEPMHLWAWQHARYPKGDESAQEKYLENTKTFLCGGSSWSHSEGSTAQPCLQS